MAEEKDKVRFYVDLTPEDHRTLRLIAASDGKTMKGVIVDCIKSRADALALKNLAARDAPPPAPQPPRPTD